MKVLPLLAQTKAHQQQNINWRPINLIIDENQVVVGSVGGVGGRSGALAGHQRRH